MNIINNEKGVALVLAMVMLVLMSILGAFALSTSTTEIGISGNYKNSQEAFYTADAAIERAHTDSAIYSTIVPGSVECWPNPLDCSATNPWSIGSNTASVNVQYLTKSDTPPEGSGYGVEDADAHYFLVEVDATGPNNSAYSAESQVARIVPTSP